MSDAKIVLSDIDDIEKRKEEQKYKKINLVDNKLSNADKKIKRIKANLKHHVMVSEYH